MLGVTERRLGLNMLGVTECRLSLVRLGSTERRLYFVFVWLGKVQPSVD